MADQLQKTLDVKGIDGDVFTFKIPTLYQDIRIGARVKEIRKLTDPDWDGFEQGLDQSTLWTMNAAATFDVSLVRSTATWPWTPAPGGAPHVDSSLFDETKVREVYFVYRGYLDAVTRFRTTGSADENPAGTQALAGQPDSESAPVSG